MGLGEKRLALELIRKRSLHHDQASKMTPKTLFCIPANFISIAAGRNDDRNPTDADYADYFESSYEAFLAMCKCLVEKCYPSQKHAIGLIVKEIAVKDKRMKAEVAAGKRKETAFLKPLEKDNPWGRAMLALVEALGFKVSNYIQVG